MTTEEDSLTKDTYTLVADMLTQKVLAPRIQSDFGTVISEEELRTFIPEQYWLHSLEGDVRTSRITGTPAQWLAWVSK